MDSTQERISSQIVRLWITAAVRYCLFAVLVLCVITQLFCGNVTILGLLGLAGFVAVGVAGLITLRKHINPNSKDLSKYALLIVVAVGIAVRIVSIAGIPNKQVSDFQIYHELGRALARGQGFSYTGFTGLREDVPIHMNQKPSSAMVPTAFRPVGYPLLLSFVYRLFGTNPLFGKYLNLLISIIAGLAVYCLLLPFDRTAALMGALVWYLYPTNILATNLMATELPFVATLVCAFVLIDRIKPSRKPIDIVYAVSAGLLLGFATLIRAELFIVPCAIVGLCMIDIPWKRLILLTSVFLMCTAIAPSIWGIRNYRQFGVFYTHSSNMGTELLKRAPENTSESLSISPNYVSLVRKLNQSSDEFERCDLGRKIAMIHMKQAIVSRGIIGCFRTIFLPNWMEAWKHDNSILGWSSVSDYYTVKHKNAKPPISKQTKIVLQRITTYSYLLISILAAAGIWVLRPERWTPGMICLSLYTIGSSVLLAIFISKPRFHFVSMTTICLFAGYCCYVLWIKKAMPDKK